MLLSILLLAFGEPTLDAGVTVVVDSQATDSEAILASVGEMPLHVPGAKADSVWSERASAAQVRLNLEAPDRSVSLAASQEVIEAKWAEALAAGETLGLELALDEEGASEATQRERLTWFNALAQATFDDDLARTARTFATNVRAKDEKYGADKVVDGDPSTFWAAEEMLPSCFLDVNLPEFTQADTVALVEAPGSSITSFILLGQVHGQWSELHRGERIGQRVLRIEPAEYQAFRFIVQRNEGQVKLATFGLYNTPPRVHVHADDTVFMNQTRVRFSTSRPDAIVRYTLDGSEPTVESTLYEGHLILDRSCVLMARAFAPGDPGCVTTVTRFRHYTHDTLKAADVEEIGAEVGYAVVQDGTFDSWEEADLGVMGDKVYETSKVELPEHAAPYYVRFQGLVQAPRPGIFTFFASGAPTRVTVGDERVFDASGEEEASGQVGLQAGWHVLRIEVLVTDPFQVFEFSYQGPAISKQPLTKFAGQ